MLAQTDYARPILADGIANSRLMRLLQDVTLTPDQRERLAQLEAYDLWFVAERLAHKGTLPLARRDAAVVEFKRYIALIALGHHGLTMLSPEVDEVWHAFILFTHEYARFCDATVGQFVHHTPFTSRSAPRPDGRPRFVQLYRAHFGDLNPEFYGHLIEMREDCDDTGSCGGNGRGVDCDDTGSCGGGN